MNRRYVNVFGVLRRRPCLAAAPASDIIISIIIIIIIITKIYYAHSIINKIVKPQT